MQYQVQEDEFAAASKHMFFQKRAQRTIPLPLNRLQSGLDRDFSLPMALLPCPIPPNFSAKPSIAGLPGLRTYAMTPGRYSPNDRSIPINPAKATQGTNLANAEVST